MKYFLYLSLWDEHNGAPGIALFELDSEKGKAQFIRKEDERTSFGDSCISRSRNLLYLCNETERVRGCRADSGSICIFRIDQEDGSLSEISRIYTYCPNPCYIDICEGGDGQEGYMIVANYGTSGYTADFIKAGDGSYTPRLCQKKSLLQIYHLDKDGMPDRITDISEHEADPESPGMGTNIHCFRLSPDGRFLAATNKGNGKLYLYRFANDSLTLELTDSALTEEGGASPRYCLFHPSLPYIYINQEKERGGRMMIETFSYDDEGRLTKVSSVNVLPAGMTVPERAHFEQQGFDMSKNGRFIYTCLKGPDSVCVLETQNDGSLKVLQHAPVTGEWPRGLSLTPDGKACIVSAHCSGELNIFRVLSDGTLDEGEVIEGPVGGSNMSFFEI